MPIPTPHDGESKDDFISRCMGDEVMQEYDQDQRAAICYSQWGEGKGYRLLGIDAFRAGMRAGAKPSARIFRVTTAKPKALDEKTRRIRFCFSDGSVDRSGDRIEPAGWDTKSFLANPIALWAHDSFSPPIGRASNVGIEGGRLMGDIEFASADVYDFADTIYKLTKGGYINAVSVGFLPLEYAFVEEKDRPWGIDFKRQELLEISVVPVPCNANALVEARAKGIKTGPITEWAARMLDGGGEVLVPRKLLEETFKAAKTPRAVRQKYLAKASEWKCGAARDLPLDHDDSWDGPAAEASIFAHAGGDDFNPELARKGFLAYDASQPKEKGSYKLPFARVVGGTLKAAKEGVRAAASRLPQAEIGDSARSEAQSVIDHYETAFGMGEGDKAQGDGADGALVPDGNCGRAKALACGMTDPEDCAVHCAGGTASPAEMPSCARDEGEACGMQNRDECMGHKAAPRRGKAGRRISAATKALLDAAMEHHKAALELHGKAMDCIKSVLDGDSDVDNEGDGDEHVDDPEKQRAERLRRARALKESLTQ